MSIGGASAGAGPRNARGPAPAVTEADARACLDDFLEFLRVLVETESPSRDEAALGRVARLVGEGVSQAGGETESFPAPGLGVHLLARFPGQSPADEKPVLVLAHMDTVHPAGTLERLPFKVAGNRIQGPGAYDMKAGLAAGLTALSLLAKKGRRSRSGVLFLFTCDEEIGSPDSRSLIEAEAQTARAGLVLEPSAPGGAAKTRRKGVAEYVLEIAGRAAHAGIEPEAGASAVHEIARQVERISAMNDLDAGATFNAGLIRGGTRANVVAEEASCAIDVRFWTKAAGERADAAMRSLAPVDPRCVLRVQGGGNRGPLEKTPASARLFEKACRVAQDVGFALGEAETGGASDGNIASAAGLAVLDGLGPDGGGAHSLAEHVLLDDVPRRIAFLSGLFERL